jgi:hypothetical protein
VISGPAGLTFTPAAASNYILDSDNSYTGNTTLNNANTTLTLVRNGDLPAAGNLVFSNAAATLAVSGDIWAQNRITSAAGGIIDVPEGSSLELRGNFNLTGAAALIKRGEGELSLRGGADAANTQGITVNGGVLTIARDGAADRLNLTINAAGILNPATAGQRHRPGAAGDTFAIGATLRASLTETNKIIPDVQENPFFFVDGNLANGGGTSIVASFPASFSCEEGDMFLVLDTDVTSPVLGAIGFVVLDDDGIFSHDFDVMRYAYGTVNNGIALRALRNIDAPAQPGAPSFTAAYDGTDLTLTFAQPPAAGTLAYTINHATFAAPLTGTVAVNGTQATVTITEELSPANGYTVTVAGYATPATFRYAPAAPVAPTAPATTDVAATYSDAAGLTFGGSAAQVAGAVADGKALSAWVWLKSGTETSSPFLADLVPAASGGYTVTVSNADIEAAFPEDDYPTLSVSAVYQLTADATVTGRTESETVRVEDSDDKPGSGGGCDAGFGLFGLLAATGAVALLRRKG